MRIHGRMDKLILRVALQKKGRKLVIGREMGEGVVKISSGLLIHTPQQLKLPNSSKNVSISISSQIF